MDKFVEINCGIVCFKNAQTISSGVWDVSRVSVGGTNIRNTAQQSSTLSTRKIGERAQISSFGVVGSFSRKNTEEKVRLL